MRWELRPPVSWVKLLSSEAVILGIRRKGPKSVLLCRDPCSSSLTYTAVIRYPTETTTSDSDPVDVSHHRLPGSFCHPSVLELILIKVPVGTSEPPLSHVSPFLSTPALPFPRALASCRLRLSYCARICTLKTEDGDRHCLINTCSKFRHCSLGRQTFAWSGSLYGKQNARLQKSLWTRRWRLSLWASFDATSYEVLFQQLLNDKVHMINDRAHSNALQYLAFALRIFIYVSLLLLCFILFLDYMLNFALFWGMSQQQRVETRE